MENLNKNYLEYEIAQLKRRLKTKYVAINNAIDVYKKGCDNFHHLQSNFYMIKQIHNNIMVYEMVIDQLKIILEMIENASTENKKHLLDVYYWCECIKRNEYQLANMDQLLILSHVINDIKDSYICYKGTFEEKLKE